jgi:hypothetical protein
MTTPTERSPVAVGGAAPGRPVPAGAGSGGERPPAPPASGAAHRFGAGRVAVVLLGALLVLGSLPALIAGGVLLGADRTQRGTDGYLTSPSLPLVTSTSALVSEPAQVRFDDGPDAWRAVRSLVGDVRLRVSPLETGTAVFVGIAPADEVARYLDGTRFATLRELTENGPRLDVTAGPGTPAPPAEQTFWTASSTGTGPQTVELPLQPGSWQVVVMNADGGPGVGVRADVAAQVPAVTGVATALLVIGGVLLVLGVVAIVLAVTTAPGSGRGDARPRPAPPVQRGP